MSRVFAAVEFVALVGWLCFMFWAIDADRRIARLEARPVFAGYLYTLNESGTWDRVRSNDLNACQYPRRCSVFLASSTLLAEPSK